jgi:methylmalonyl-CoA/ethylmalonyl-CoA epimerase
MGDPIADTIRPDESPGLPPPDQIGFVVRDLDAALQLYEPLFGPFTRPEFGPQQASYRGEVPSSYSLDFAFGRAGDLEIELIAWVSGDTPHRDFVRAGREGMHHLRYRIDDLDTYAARLKAKGYETAWEARMTPDIAFAYFDRPGDPLAIELFQYNVAGNPLAETP